MTEGIIVGALIMLGIYFLPTIIGYCRAKKNILAIFVLNFTLGWTIIGWIIALIWACTHEEGRENLARGRPVIFLKIVIAIIIAVAFLQVMVEELNASGNPTVTFIVLILVGLLVYLAYHKKWIKFKK